MKRLIPGALFGAACFLAGYMVNPRAGVVAQSQTTQANAATSGPPATRAVNGKGLYYSIDEIKSDFRRRTRTVTFPREIRAPQTTWHGLLNTALP